MKARLSLDQAERGAEGGPSESDDVETWETRQSLSGGGENIAEQKKKKTGESDFPWMLSSRKAC